MDGAAVPPKLNADGAGVDAAPVEEAGVDVPKVVV